MRRLFVDTSAWFAFSNRRDPEHAAVASVLAEGRPRLVTSTHVFDEVVTLSQSRLGFRAATQVGRVLRDPSAVDLVRATAADEEAAWTLFLSRPDKGCSFTDCTSFVLMRRLGLDTAVALDEAFRQEGFAVLP